MKITYQEPVWTKHFTTSMPDGLMLTGSMTKRMQAISEQCFQVELLTQTWQSPRPSEALLLSVSKYSSAMVREVYLLCDGSISMFARSLFPVDILFGKGWQLQYLGEKPLGALLFSDPKLQRNPFEFALLSSEHADYHTATQHLAVKPKSLWARRSVFYWEQKELMVQEVFLPDLFNSLGNEPHNPVFGSTARHIGVARSRVYFL